MSIEPPRHVLHVLNSAAGGAALSTIALIEGLRARGIESSAVCHNLGNASELEALEAATAGRVLFRPLYWWNRKIRTPAWKRPLGELRQLWRTGWKRQSTADVVLFAQLHQADLIHSNTIVTLEGALAARQLGRPHIWHLRELVGPGHPYRLPYEGPALGRFLQAHAAKVIANSQATAAAVRAWLPPGLLEVVPNGIDLARFVPRRRDDTRRPLVVAMVGNLTTRWKNHLLFVRAAALVDRALPIQWRIYGHDPSQGGRSTSDEYVNRIHEEIHRARLSDRFQLAGYHTDPAEIMSAVDLLVHPTASESFGRVIVEAMAAGLAVVGVAAGGVGEIVKHEETGLLAPVDDAEALARDITRLVNDPEERARFSAAGRRRAHECYSLEACVSGVLRIYGAAVAAGTSRRAGSPSSASNSGASTDNAVSLNR